MTSHPEVRTAAPYVLGALRGAERERFVDHLATCEECRTEVGRLSVLPELLALVPADVAAALADDDAPSEARARHARDATPDPMSDDVPPSVLDALLRAAREEERLEGRRARRRRVVVALAAAAALVVGGVVVGQLVDGPWSSDTPSAAPTPTPTATPTARTRTVTLDAVDGSAPITATAVLTDVPWGTRIELSCTYDSPYGQGAEYALVVRDASGREDRVATWTAVPGRTLTVPGATALSLADVVAVEMVRPDGTAVLRWAA